MTDEYRDRDVWELSTNGFTQQSIRIYSGLPLADVEHSQIALVVRVHEHREMVPYMFLKMSPQTILKTFEAFLGHFFFGPIR